MLSQTDLERERYEARRKWQLDYNTGLKVARLEGIEEGVAKGREEGRRQGEKIGTIHALQRVLNRPETPTADLMVLSIEELTRLVGELQAQLPKQN